MKLIFIFSLPRSGSTLLQRLLSNHSKVDTAPETWLLFPLLHYKKENTVLTEYNHLRYTRAVNEFIKSLPYKSEDYERYIKEFVVNIYKCYSSKNKIYFLEKTPRYYYYADDIIKIFPDSKFIFLFRNPASILGSIINSFGGGRLNHLFGTYNDLAYGHEFLTNAYDKNKDKALKLNYEELVSKPEKNLEVILNYLELGKEELLSLTNNEKFFTARLGDKTGIQKYSQISSESIEKWDEVIINPLRKYLFKYFIEIIPNKCFEIEGYDRQNILYRISAKRSHSLKNIWSDLVDIIKTYLKIKFKLHLFFSKQFSWTHKKYFS